MLGVEIPYHKVESEIIMESFGYYGYKQLTDSLRMYVVYYPQEEGRYECHATVADEAYIDKTCVSDWRDPYLGE